MFVEYESVPKEALVMLRTLILSSAIAAGALQAAPTPQAPTYDAKFVSSEGQAYTGTVTFAVDAKGVVTGTMKLVDPVQVLGKLGGTVKDGKWTFEYPYEIPEQGCTGTVKGEGKVSADNKTVEGSGVAGGGCAEQPIQLTFTFTKQAK
jgi:hypothetical protein